VSRKTSKANLALEIRKDRLTRMSTQARADVGIRSAESEN